MASCSRAHAIKAALVVAFLLILLNLLSSRRDTTPPLGLPRMGSTQWPKRTRTSSERLVHHHHHHDANESSNGQQQHPHDQTAPSSKLLNSAALAANSTQKSHSKTNESQPIVTEAGSSSDHNDESNNNVKNSTSLSRTENLVESSNSSYASRDKSKVPEGVQQSAPRNSTNPVPQQTENDVAAPPPPSLIDGLLPRRFGEGSCPPIPPSLDGPYEVDPNYESLTSVEQKLAPKLQPGGQYSPRECSARDRVAIVVPYRDREQHLPVFLKNLHPFLMKQQIEYGIYIVEQSAGTQFNRASLMNVGFMEAMRQKSWDCMVFHDVDLLPMDDRNLYTCPDQPRHMSVAVDTFGFKLPYTTIFGGVSAMTVKQFRTVNGFSNSFWGWGGEDDDMSNRLKHVGFHIARYPINIARYTMLSHKKEKANPKRYEKLNTGAKRFDSDGLNSLHYKLINLIRKPLYTWVHVEISPESS